MTKYAQPLDKRFSQTLVELQRTVRKLQSRTASIDSGQPFAVLNAVVSPSYTSGDPEVFLNGSASLSGPYQVLNGWVPSPGAACLAMPVQGTYVLIGTAGQPGAWQTLALTSGWTATNGPIFRLQSDGNTVLVLGSVTHGTFSTNLQLSATGAIPAALRPINEWNLGSPGIAGRAGAEVLPSGTIMAVLGSLSSASECDISGVYPLNQ